MPRSFLIKKNNYSNCPLKKRPVQLSKELLEDDDKDMADNSEPENLSTKPQDLSMSAAHHHQQQQQQNQPPSPAQQQNQPPPQPQQQPQQAPPPPPQPQPAAQHYAPHKAVTPPPGVALISAVKRTPLSDAAASALNSQHPAPHPHPGLASPPPQPHHPHPHHPHLPHHPAFLVKSSGGPLEPLNLNTPAEPLHHPSPYTSPPPVWPPGRAMSAAAPPPHHPHYPPPYLTFNYPYPPAAELYGSHHAYPPAPGVVYPLSPARSPLEQQLSPYAPRDSSASPPHPYASSLAHRPGGAAGPEPPKLFVPYPPSAPDHCGLSPTSSVASSSSHTVFQPSSPPPATPEDLSSPGSVSSGSSSAGSTSAGSKKRKEAGAPRYQCPDCSKSYSTYSGLSKHQQFHCAASAGAQAKKSFSCKYCEKVYVSLGALKMHIRTHTLPCKCRLCGKAFSRPWLLQGHIRTHTGEKPFSCQHCNRAFADRSNLRAHLQTHSDVKKYSCTSCSKTFSRMSLLTKHMDGGCPGAAAVATGHLPHHLAVREPAVIVDEVKVFQ